MPLNIHVLQVFSLGYVCSTYLFKHHVGQFPVPLLEHIIHLDRNGLVEE